MKKLWNGLIYLLILSGFPLLAYAGYYLAKDTYVLWKHGIERQASVIALDHTSRAYKAGTTYHYCWIASSQHIFYGMVLLVIM